MVPERKAADAGFIEASKGGLKGEPHASALSLS
jgi:hypothetical protein